MQAQEVVANYFSQINPEKVGTRWEGTRAEKDVRYYNFHRNKEGLSIADKERFAIELLKKALEKAEKPVVSCSFGIDSIVSLYLTRKALVEMGRDASDVQVVWNDTLNEFPETRIFAKQLKDDWALNLIVTRPKKVLKKVIDDNGGITSDYFTARKGSRTEGKPLSEKCCHHLKHQPMKWAIKDHTWDLVINGLRADESTQRLRAGLRDGEYFYSSSEWKAYVARPIMWFTEDDVWKYVFSEGIPFNSVYNHNSIMAYPDNTAEIVADCEKELVDLNINVTKLSDKQLVMVNKQQSLYLKKIGFTVSRPVRVGCMMCPIPIKYGYLQWIRQFYPKIYNAMVFNLGYGKALLTMIPEETREEIKAFTGIDVTAENAHEHLQEILEAKPCTFDSF